MKTYTTVERIFRSEFTFLRLCGGLLFERPLPIAIAYRLIVLITFRYLITKHYAKYLPIIETYPKSTQQNIRVFLGFYTIAGYLASILAFYTGLKYHRLILVLVRKKLDCRYLDERCLDWNESKRAQKMNSSSLSRSSRTDEESNWSTRSSIVHILSTFKPHRFRQARYLLIYNWVLNTLTSYLRYWTYTTYLAEGKIPSQRHLRVTDIYPPIVFREYVIRGDIPERPSFQPTQQNNLLDIIISSYHFAISLVSSLWFKCTVAQAINELYHFLWDMITSATHICQTYGSLILVLMITSVMTDMLRFSSRSDGICKSDFRGQASRDNSRYTLVYADSRSSSTRDASLLLTTKLLIQIRDVLIILRCIISIEYLVLLCGDFARIMTVICLLIDTVNRYQTISVVMNLIEFCRIIYSMLLMRLGHDWLHKEANRFRRLLDQRFLLDEEGSRATAAISRGERTTLNRLTEDIESIWGTDWYSPDFGSFIKQNIILMTFVATLQQLVEAGSQVNYFANNSTGANVATNSTSTRWIPNNRNDTLRILLDAV